VAVWIIIFAWTKLYNAPIQISGSLRNVFRASNATSVSSVKGKGRILKSS
jgi:hypothetical protein